MRMKPAKILVIGDFMLDVYTFGNVERISPEAPVPILHREKEKMFPGGAGNVALNLISLGMQVVGVGRIGKGEVGTTLLKLLAAEDVDIRGIITDEKFQTPRKNRIIAGNQQLMRIDDEAFFPLEEALEKGVRKNLENLFEGVSAVAISDYAKGFLTKSLLSAVIALAQKRSLPIIADPKGADFSKYYGCDVLKPNLKEAYLAAEVNKNVALEEVAQRILEMGCAKNLIITRAQEGISLFTYGQRKDFSVKAQEVKDVTGAGDTVLAVITAALANDQPLAESIALANVAAGLAIKHFGCARVSLEEMLDYVEPQNKKMLLNVR